MSEVEPGHTDNAKNTVEETVSINNLVAECEDQDDDDEEENITGDDANDKVSCLLAESDDNAVECTNSAGADNIENDEPDEEEEETEYNENGEEEQEQNFGSDESNHENLLDDPLLSGFGTTTSTTTQQEEDAEESTLNLVDQHNDLEEEEQAENAEETAAGDITNSGDKATGDDGDSNSNNPLSDSDNFLTMGENEDDSQTKSLTCENENSRDSENKQETETLIGIESTLLPEETVEDQTKSPSDKANNIEDKDDDDEEIEPTLRVRIDGIFESENADDDDDDEKKDDKTMDPSDIQNMLHMSFQEDEQNANTGNSAIELDSGTESPSDVNTESAIPTRRTLPRRAAAAAAANTIRVISTEELDVDDTPWRRGRSRDYDKDYDNHAATREVSGASVVSTGSSRDNRNKCHVCKKWTVCQIKIQQFGTDIYICTHKCLNTMRHPNANGKSRLQCAKCGISNQTSDQESVYYWETMNFCSDLCVGNYQMDVGGKCATCFKRVPWLSLGKYCVRFGSDIRQFCTASCLESYKKNARVCFHCQLDIKRLGNVILANIPAKNSPKEFCSQDCVEMYVEQNLNQTVKSKAGQIYTCVMCGQSKTCFREIVLPSLNALKTCSNQCWVMLIESKNLVKTVKCETCTKFINMGYDFEPPAHYVSSEEKVFGFCSATCKNVFVLKNRQILSCTTCKVKKYNYDLVQFFSNRSFAYAVCSLNCLPQSVEYITSLKNTLSPISTASEMISRSSTSSAAMPMEVESFPVINSVTSIPSLSRVVMSNEINSENQAYLDSVANSVVCSTGITTADYTNLSDYFEMDPSSSGNLVVESGCHDFELLKDDLLADWDGILRHTDIEEVLELDKPAPEMKTKYVMAKPKSNSIETQTDESALTNMERLPLKTLDKIRYVPIPIPYPVYIPVPTYLLETPVPYPFPFPIPIPIPIPIICGNEKSSLPLPSQSQEATTCISANSLESNDHSEIEMTEISENDNINGHTESNGCPEAENSDNIEMMDCSSSSGTPNPDAEFNSTSFSVSYPLTENTITSSVVDAEETSVQETLTFNSSSSVSSPFSVSTNESSPARRKLTRVEYGIRAWKMSFGPTSDPQNYSSAELASKLAEWVKKGTKPNGERYRADIFIYLCLGIQQHLRENNRRDSIFYDNTYFPFIEAITNYAESDCAQGINSRIEETHFWESKQLGASSPGVLLFTLMYFFTKSFHIKSWEKHAALHLGQIRIADRHDGIGMYMSIVDIPDCEGIEVQERLDKMDRCPVKLLRFYISKCEQPDGPLYKAIKPDGDYRTTWYISESLEQMQIYRMFVRAMMIKAEFDQS